MKSRLLNAWLLACALLMALSGCSSDETLAGDSNTAVKNMKINVSDGLFISVDKNGAKTRATDDGTETTFGTGDAIGIFIVKADGTLALTNAKYTYDGTYWLNSAGKDYLPYYDGAKYFSYYPYQANLASDKYDATQTTAETFFASLISGWTPAADQSTQTKYTAQDLMVSLAIIDPFTYSSSFFMSHQMSMLEMDFHQAHYTYGGADVYRFTFDAPSKPFNIAAGKYRLLVNPSTSLSITGYNQFNSTDPARAKGWQIIGTAPAKAKYKVYKYNGASASLTETARQNICIGSANIGDYLYADGTTGTTALGKTIVGIVFSDQINSAEYAAGYTHGYVLALTDASGAGPAWGPADDAGLTKAINIAGYYNELADGYSGTFTKQYNKSNVNYPAWQFANNYNVDVSGFLNTGWYLPSAGQWWDVCANLGKVDLSSQQSSSTVGGPVYSGTTATINVNNAITAAGGTALISNHYYWSASELNARNVSSANFRASSFYLSVSGKDDPTNYVRAVLAF